MLAAAGIVLSLLYTGSALATTAIGTLIPILSDSGELRTRFGTYLLAAGAVGEFGPILLLTLVLSTQSTAAQRADPASRSSRSRSLVAVFAVRFSERTLPLFERTLESSSQLAVRWILVLIFALALLAYHLGLDLLLGGFAAGMITRQVLETREMPGVRLEARRGRVRRVRAVLLRRQRHEARRRRAVRERRRASRRWCVFFVLFLVVRGTPALLLYRHVLDARERVALALMSSTQLPLVLAITTLATASGHMRPSTAAALVGAAVLSTLVFPMLGLRLRGDIEPGTLQRESAASVA